LGTTFAAVVGLSWPPPQAAIDAPAESTPFRWDAAALFADLQDEFDGARDLTPEGASSRAAAIDEEGAADLAGIASSPSVPLDELQALAERQFQYAVLAAAHPSLMPSAEAFVVRARVAVMRAAAAWPSDRQTHSALYRLVFGGRIALEEALVQTGPVLPALVSVEAIASQTPWIEVEGVRVHSGDILLSRGGAPTSALIARGSDYSNTFSHAALAHVDADTGVGTVIESLIETGTVLTTVEEYLAGRKHRILLLRLRPDLPELLADPQLPHRASTRMLARLTEAPAAYDFAMDWQDSERMFCSEVIYHAYEGEGLDLWSIRSAMTAPGLVRWLGGMGVREFRTLVPSDLEYDARLRAVVEWRDLDALMEYRFDNAITDALLGAADDGADLGYSVFARPFGRLLKGFSVAQAGVGMPPFIPTGMSADAALRVRALVSTVSPALKEALMEREAAFHVENGYRAPYWTLVELAVEVVAAERDRLAPALR
jgi:Permuted papain-like amidase enzyme, YaeF/YiiX, C92 family